MLLELICLQALPAINFSNIHISLMSLGLFYDIQKTQINNLIQAIEHYETIYKNLLLNFKTVTQLANDYFSQNNA